MARYQLFIIGNGFDLCHGLPTSYLDFEQYAQQNNPKAYRRMSDLFKIMNTAFPAGDKASWNNFETALGLIDAQTYRDNILALCPPVASDNAHYSFAATGDVQLLASLFHSAHIDQTQNTFRDWIASINIPPSAKRKFPFSDNACFVSFNYIDTLQTLYDVDPLRVFHVHGCRLDGEFAPVVGHGKSVPSYTYTQDCPPEFHPSNPWAQYFRTARKNVPHHCDQLRLHLQSLCGNIDSAEVEINAVGHSYNDIDQPYFEKIRQLLPNAAWRLAYHSSCDQVNASALESRLGLFGASIVPFSSFVF